MAELDGAAGGLLGGFAGATVVWAGGAEDGFVTRQLSKSKAPLSKTEGGDPGRFSGLSKLVKTVTQEVQKV